MIFDGLIYNIFELMESSEGYSAKGDQCMKEAYKKLKGIDSLT